MRRPWGRRKTTDSESIWRPSVRVGRRPTSHLTGSPDNRVWLGKASRQRPVLWSLPSVREQGPGTFPSEYVFVTWLPVEPNHGRRLYKEIP